MEKYELNNPIVSILIPLYNCEKFIAGTIHSVLNQTWPNIELIIVDDGSTDNSFQVAKSFQSQKLKVFTQKNKGACTARNFAFRESKGDFIQYLDADDILTPNKLEAQLALFKEFGSNIIANCKWGRFTDNLEKAIWEQQSINRDYDFPIDWLEGSWMGNGMSANSCWLLPRQIIEKAGLWDESLLINQDGEFFTRVLMLAQAIKFAPDAGVYYRSGNPQSITQSKPHSREKAESLLKSYQSYKQVLSVHDTPAIRKALGNNYLNYMYQFYSSYPDLSNKAELAFKELGLRRMWPVGGRLFKKLVKIMGFKNALFIQKLLS